MKRRDIMKGAGTLLAGIPLVTESQTRRFGVPGSISEANPTRQARLHLALAKGEIPIQFWQTIERVDALWRTVTTDAAARGEFRRDPGGVIAAHGIDPSLMSGSDRESRVLRASRTVGDRRSAPPGLLRFPRSLTGDGHPRRHGALRAGPPADRSLPR